MHQLADDEKMLCNKQPQKSQQDATRSIYLTHEPVHHLGGGSSSLDLAGLDRMHPFVCGQLCVYCSRLSSACDDSSMALSSSFWNHQTSPGMSSQDNGRDARKQVFLLISHLLTTHWTRKPNGQIQSQGMGKSPYPQ